MGILQKALKMLEKRPLCDHCLGRQFALLGYGVENDERGRALKLTLTLKAHAILCSKNREATGFLKILATNGFFRPARQLLEKNKSSVSSKEHPKECYLCEGKFGGAESLASKALKLLESCEYSNFLVGVEMPLEIEEREDEFRSEFGVSHGENMRNEFGRLVGKKIVEASAKSAEFLNPEIVVLVDPFAEKVQLEVNPLFVTGRYRKLIRGIPQSKWFCRSCRGRGCKKCGGTGKMYPESVEEIIGKPLLDATGGTKSSFHASGREDIDARMLGSGRPFVIEIAQPRKRFLDLVKLRAEVNAFGKGKVQVSRMKLAGKDAVRRLKKGESTRKEYRVLVEFEGEVTAKDLQSVKKKLTNTLINQKTPNRVLHRRADLMREKYIYSVNVRKLAPKKAEMRILCQGGLYVKELVHGDGGRTTPNVSEILNIKAKPLKLDVLKVSMKE